MKSDLKNTWELLRPHVRPQLPLLGVAVLLGVITSSIQGGAILLFEPIWNLVLFDEAAGAEAPTGLTRHFAALQDWMTEGGAFEDKRVAILVAVSSLGFLMALTGAAAQFGFTRLTRLIGFRMIVDLRVRLARHLMGLSVRYHGERQFGDLLSRISSDVTTTLNSVNVGLKKLLLEPLYAATMITVAFLQAPWPTLGILVVIPIGAIPISRLMSKVQRRSTRSHTTLGASVQALTQMFQGFRTVKAFGGEEGEIERYRELNESYLHSSMKMVRAIALTHAWTAFSSIAGVSLLVLLLGLLTIRFELFQTGGQMSVFFLAVGMLNNHIKGFIKALTKVEESVGASVRIQALLDEPPDVLEAEEPRRVDAFVESIQFEHLSFRYPEGPTDAIRDLNLEVKKGETLALVGPSGAGKSTLVDLVARFIDPSRGRILVDGVDLRELALADWTGLYALVGQVPFLFHASVRENIRYGRPQATDAQVVAAARAAGIHDFVMGLPGGYDADVADMGSRLSGGQRQRITIARALLKEAPILLLDEATSALDSESEAAVQSALEHLMQDRTVIVIAHRLSTIRNADRIAVFEEGRLVELGVHDELLASGATYARLHSLQHVPEPSPGS